MKTNFTTQIIKNLDEAKKWWELFSPRTFLHDEWEFRYCFYKYFQYELFFYVGFVDDIAMGLLPLEWNSEKKHLQFFGGEVMNNNRVFILPQYKEYVPPFFEQLTDRSELIHLNDESKYISSLPVVEQQYILDLRKFNDFSSYLNDTFSGKSRGVLLKKNRLIENQHIKIEDGNQRDLDYLFKFNIQRFGEESSFLFPNRQKVYHDFFSLPFKYSYLLFKKENQILGASFSFLHNSGYVFFNSGYDETISNLGTYIYYKNIEKAFEKGMSYFDASTGSFSWKERFHLDPFPQHCFKNYE